MIKRFNANNARLRRHQRMRSHFEGTPARPRLNVFRSGHHIYAQIIDDTTGITLAAASSLDESLRDFKPAAPGQEQPSPAASSAEKVETVAVAAEAAAVSKSKAPKAQKAPAKGGPVGKGGKPGTQVKTLLPQAVRGEKKTPVEALAPIAHNRKVATAREVGKLLAQRAKEKDVSRVVFDRGGYAYHGRVAALAEGAREVGLEF
jgi:ribosomal protein L18